MFRRTAPNNGLQRPEAKSTSTSASTATSSSSNSGSSSSQNSNTTTNASSSTPTNTNAAMTQNKTPDTRSAAPQQAASAPAQRPLGITPANPLGSGPGNKQADLPMSRFGGIPGVMPRRVGSPGEGMGAPSSYGSGSHSTGIDQSGLRKLTVGREITLSGDITTCDILVVEGNIDATLRDGKVLEISQDGHFRGAAEVDEADIGGKIEGTLTVRGRLRLRSTGQIEGAISYGELEVEAGGRMIGELKVLGASSTQEDDKSETNNKSQNQKTNTANAKDNKTSSDEKAKVPASAEA